MRAMACGVLWGMAVVLGEAEAGFKLPRGVYTLEQVEEARKEAEAKSRLVGFLFTNTETDCGLCANASLAMVEELDSVAVMVYAPYAERCSWPPALRRAQQEDTGKYIPKLFLFAPDLEELKATVHYETYKSEGIKALRRVKKELKKP